MSVELNKRGGCMINIQRDLAYLGHEWHRSMCAEAIWVHK